MPRTLLVIPNPIPGTGGAETHYMEIMRSLVRSNTAVLLLCAQSPHEAAARAFDRDMLDQDVKVVRIPLSPPNLYTSRNALSISLRILAFWIFSLYAGFGVLRGYRPTYCLLRHSILLLPFAVLIHLAGVKVIADGHLLSETDFRLYYSDRAVAQHLTRHPIVEQLVQSLVRQMETAMFSFYDIFRAYSPIIAADVRDFLGANLGHSGPEIVMIPPSIDPENIPQTTDPQRDVRGIAYFGVLERWWGVDTLVRSFSAVSRDFPDVRLYIYGDGPTARSLSRLVSESPASSSITLSGAIPREQMLRKFDNFDIAVVPLLSRAPPGIPIKLVEALMGGKATIVTDVDLFRDILSGDEVLFVRPNDVDQLAESITKLIVDDDLRRKLSVNGREKALKIFDARENYPKMWGLLQENHSLGSQR